MLDPLVRDPVSGLLLGPLGVLGLVAVFLLRYSLFLLVCDGSVGVDILLRLDCAVLALDRLLHLACMALAHSSTAAEIPGPTRGKTAAGRDE